MAMKEGDVVLTPLPQADGQVKNRPAVVLRAMPPHGDLLVCGISTQVRHEVSGFDEIITEDDPDFAPSGLKAASLIRLGFLAVLPAGSFLGSIGAIDKARHPRLLKRVRTMKLRRAFKGVHYEPDYLYEQQPAGADPSEDEKDRELFAKVALLKNPAWPKRVLRQYTESHAAMNRMRKEHSRKRVAAHRLPCNAPHGTVW